MGSRSGEGAAVIYRKRQGDRIRNGLGWDFVRQLDHPDRWYFGLYLRIHRHSVVWRYRSWTTNCASYQHWSKQQEDESIAFDRRTVAQ